MIELKINGQSVDLLPDTEIEITENREVFDLNKVEGTSSIPFDLAPSAQNRRLFGFIDEPSSTAVFETEYEASLAFGSGLTIEGVFILRKVKKRQTLNGYFYADAAALASEADTRIRDLVAGEIEVLQKSDVDLINADPATNFVFATYYVAQQNDKGDFFLRFNEVPGTGLQTYYPNLKLRYIIELVFAGLGYTVQMDFADATFDQCIWIDRTIPFLNTVFPNRWQRADLCPDVSFTEFLRSIRAVFNLKVTIDPSAKRATFEKIQDLYESSSENFTDYFIPEVEIERIDEEDLEESVISFSVAPQNELDEVEFLPDVRRFPFTAPPAADAGKILTVEFDCYYYQVVELENPVSGTPTYEYVPFARNTVPQAIAGLTDDVESLLSPAPTQEMQYQDSQGVELVDNGSGKVRLKIDGSIRFGPGAVGLGKIRLIGEDIPYDRQFVDITAISTTFVDLDMNYIEDVTVDFQFRIRINEPAPILRDVYAEDAGGGLSVFYGRNSGINGLGDYYYASPSVFDTDFTTVLGVASLIFKTEYGLFAQYYQAVAQRIGSAVKKATFSLWLPVWLLSRRKANFIVLDGVRYLVSQFKFKLSNRTQRRAQCTVEGRITD